MQLLAVADVAGERLLVRDRHRLGRLGRTGRGIDAAGPLAQLHAAPGRAGARASRSSPSSARRADRGMPGVGEPRLRLGADARQRPHGQRRQERRLAAGGHDRDPARLARVRADLGHHLARRHAERAREPQALAHGELDQRRPARRDRPRAAPGSPRRCRPARPPARGSRPAPRPAATSPGRCGGRAQEHDLGAAAAGLGAAHGRADAVAAGLVAGRRHHPRPARIAADDERLPAQLRVAVQLDGGEEGVEVEVGDHTREDSGPAVTNSARPGTAQPAAAGQGR